jgi:diaminopimelate decarboxylase
MPTPPQSTRLLPDTVLIEFVKTHFKHKKTYLAAVENNGSPLWILDTGILKAKAQRFSNAFNACFDRTRFYFAMKSNNHPEVSKTLLESGFGLDVSSGEELTTALMLKCNDIIFSGPGKTDPELTLAAQYCDKTLILLDSFGELERLNAIVRATDCQSPVRVGIRLTTNPNGLWRKFGIVLEKLPEFWNRVQQLSPKIQFKGIQFHSSWNLTPDRQVEFIRVLGNTLKTMPEAFNRSVEFIDIGGGYWPEEGEWLHFPETLENGTAALPKDRPMTAVAPHYWIKGTPIETFAKSLFNAIDSHLFPHVSCRI